MAFNIFDVGRKLGYGEDDSAGQSGYQMDPSRALELLSGVAQGTVPVAGDKSAVPADGGTPDVPSAKTRDDFLSGKGPSASPASPSSDGLTPEQVRQLREAERRLGRDPAKSDSAWGAAPDAVKVNPVPPDPKMPELRVPQRAAPDAGSPADAGAQSEAPLTRSERERYAVLDDQAHQELELQAALRDAQDARRIGLIGSATSAFADSMTSPDRRTGSGFWDKYVQSGEQNVRDLLGRRQAAQALERATQERLDRVAMNDPDSAQSQTIREIITKYGGPELAKIVEGKSGTELAKLYPFIDDLVKSGQLRAKVEQDLLKRQREADELYNGLRMLYPESAKELDSLKTDLNGLRAFQQKAIADSNRDSAFKNQMAAAAIARGDTQAFAKYMKDFEHQYQTEERQRREGREERLGMPSGYTALPDQVPSPNQKQQANDIIAEARTIGPSIDELDALLKKSGVLAALQVGDFGTAEARRARQLTQQIANAFQKMENLGVPSGKDTSITKALQGDPTSMWTIISGNSAQSIAEMRRYARQKVDAKLKTFGIVPLPGTPEPMDLDRGTEVPSDKVKIRRKGTTDVRLVDPDKAKQILTDPKYERVEE